MRTLAESNQDVREIERSVLIALRTDDFRSLWQKAREVALRIYENQRRNVLDDLRSKVRPGQELTRREAMAEIP